MRNGLIVLILIVLAGDAAVVIARFDDDDEPTTEVSPAPTPVARSTTTVRSTVAPTTTAPATPAGPAATASPTTLSPGATASPTTTRAAGGLPSSAAGSATTVPPRGSPAVTPTTEPATTATTVRPLADGAHPKTGGSSLLLPALALMTAGLYGLRLSGRSSSRARSATPIETSSDSNTHTNKEGPWPPIS